MRLRLLAKRMTALVFIGALVLANFSVPLRTAAVAPAPSLEEVGATIEAQTNLDITWTKMAGIDARGAFLRGTSTMGDNLPITIWCVVTYPPLSIRCTITVNMTEAPPVVTD